MATLYLKDFITQNNFKDPYAATWQLALDPEFKEVFFTDEMDTNNIYRVNISIDPVLVRDYTKKVYVRVKLHYKANAGRIVDSDWFVLPENRNETDYLILKRNGFSVGFIDRTNNGFIIDDFIEK